MSFKEFIEGIEELESNVGFNFDGVIGDSVKSSDSVLKAVREFDTLSLQDEELFINSLSLVKRPSRISKAVIKTVM